MSALTIYQFGYMSDNYGVLLHSPQTGETAMIDAGDATAAFTALEQQGWALSHLFVTHHHADHIAGLEKIKSQTGCTVHGPDGITGVDKTLSEGDTFSFAGVDVHVLHTPGHTLDMLNYHLPSESIVFTGDTLFTLGCGRLFEGDAPTMWRSLRKLKSLPGDTWVYGSHEYTQANARFALSVDPNNDALQQRAEQIDKLRAENQATVPTKLADELATNPFLRPDDPAIRDLLGMQDATDEAVFAEIRQRKDNF
jgi:hydroxyacylglutathione hydrolase